MPKKVGLRPEVVQQVQLQALARSNGLDVPPGLSRAGYIELLAARGVRQVAAGSAPPDARSSSPLIEGLTQRLKAEDKS